MIMRATHQIAVTPIKSPTAKEMITVRCAVQKSELLGFDSCFGVATSPDDDDDPGASCFGVATEEQNG